RAAAPLAEIHELVMIQIVGEEDQSHTNGAYAVEAGNVAGSRQCQVGLARCAQRRSPSPIRPRQREFGRQPSRGVGTRTTLGCSPTRPGTRAARTGSA